MEKVPTLAGTKYEPDLFSFDPLRAQERHSMSQILAQAQQQVEALSIMSEEEGSLVWKVVAAVAVGGVVALAVRRYYKQHKQQGGSGGEKSEDQGQAGSVSGGAGGGAGETPAAGEGKVGPGNRVSGGGDDAVTSGRNAGERNAGERDASAKEDAGDASKGDAAGGGGAAAGQAVSTAGGDGSGGQGGPGTTSADTRTAKDGGYGIKQLPADTSVDSQHSTENTEAPKPAQSESSPPVKTDPTVGISETQAGRPPTETDIKTPGETQPGTQSETS